MEKRLFTKLWWRDALERMIATFAQVALSLITVLYPTLAVATGQDLQMLVSNVFSTLPLILFTSLGGAFYSLLKSIVAAYTANTDTASFSVDNKPLSKE